MASRELLSYTIKLGLSLAEVINDLCLIACQKTSTAKLTLRTAMEGRQARDGTIQWLCVVRFMRHCYHVAWLVSQLAQRSGTWQRTLSKADA